MNRINWKKLRQSIRPFVEVAPHTTYEVLFIDEFKDTNTLGETRFEPNQIVIKNGLSDKLSVSVYLHELTHSISEEYDAKLTESQVLAIEKSLPFLLKKGNIFLYEEKSKKKSSKKVRKSRKKAKK